MRVRHILVIAVTVVACYAWPSVETEVKVDARLNCLEASYPRVGRRLHLEPGLYTISVEPGTGILYGAAYRDSRPVNVILRFDPACVSEVVVNGDGSVQRGQPRASAVLVHSDANPELAQIEVLATAATDVYAMHLDLRASDNVGGVSVRVDRGPAAEVSQSEKPIARVRVDGERNCIVTDIRRVAAALRLHPGTYHLGLSRQGGAIDYGDRTTPAERASDDVILDLDPGAVSVYSPVGPDGDEVASPAAALSLSALRGDVNIRVQRPTTAYAYVMDLDARDNSGAVWVGATPGCVGLVARATVDARENCLEVDYRSIASPLSLEPGDYTLTLEAGEGVSYSSRAPYLTRRAQNVLLDFDPACVLIGPVPLICDAPAATACLLRPEGLGACASLYVRVLKPTVAYAYLVDQDPSDNDGTLSVRVYRGHGSSLDESDLAQTVTVDARRNCIALDVRRVAKPITLAPGHYRIGLAGGSIIYGVGAEYLERPCANVFIDCDPADVSLRRASQDGHQTGPVGALALSAARPTIGIEVHRATTLWAYLIDLDARGNSGHVVVEVDAGEPGP